MKQKVYWFEDTLESYFKHGSGKRTEFDEANMGKNRKGMLSLIITTDWLCFNHTFY
jgi:hypothetical protein